MTKSLKGRFEYRSSPEVVEEKRKLLQEQLRQLESQLELLEQLV